MLYKKSQLTKFAADIKGTVSFHKLISSAEGACIIYYKSWSFCDPTWTYIMPLHTTVNNNPRNLNVEKNNLIKVKLARNFSIRTEIRSLTTNKHRIR